MDTTLNVTPAPRGERNWRTTGTHVSYDGSGDTIICGCGPANHLSGPQWAVVKGVEYCTPQRLNA